MSIADWGVSSPAPMSPATRIHRARVRRVLSDYVYQFTIPGLDGGRSIFGPAVGPPGLSVGAEPYALPTIDGEWFLYDPTIMPVEGGGGGETDPIAGPALAEHEAATTNVHGIVDTADLIVEGDARLTNARTPTVHAPSHATGGTDPLSPAAIGAATVADITAAVAAHEGDTTSVHGIADTSLLDTIALRNAAIATHEADTTSVHGIADTSLLDTIALRNAAIATHEADTTAVHGIANTANLVLTSDSRLSDARIAAGQFLDVTSVPVLAAGTATVYTTIATISRVLSRPTVIIAVWTPDAAGTVAGGELWARYSCSVTAGSIANPNAFEAHITTVPGNYSPFALVGSWAASAAATFTMLIQYKVSGAAGANGYFNLGTKSPVSVFYIPYA